MPLTTNIRNSEVDARAPDLKNLQQSGFQLATLNDGELESMSAQKRTVTRGWINPPPTVSK